jgi:hypothetical protein
MDTKLYRIYPAAEYGAVPENCYADQRWNLALTEFIVEFKTTPINIEGTLNNEQASAIMVTAAWTDYNEEL